MWGAAEGDLAERAHGTLIVRWCGDAGDESCMKDDESVSVEGFVDDNVDFHDLLGMLWPAYRVTQLSSTAIGRRHLITCVRTSNLCEVGELIDDDHRDIAEAVMAGRPIKARDLMREHVDKIAATYEQRAGGSVLDQLIEWR